MFAVPAWKAAWDMYILCMPRIACLLLPASQKNKKDLHPKRPFHFIYTLKHTVKTSKWTAPEISTVPLSWTGPTLRRFGPGWVQTPIAGKVPRCGDQCLLVLRILELFLSLTLWSVAGAPSIMSHREDVAG